MKLIISTLIKSIQSIPKNEHKNVTPDIATKFTYMHIILLILTFKGAEMPITKGIIIFFSSIYHIRLLIRFSGASTATHKLN